MNPVSLSSSSSASLIDLVGGEKLSYNDYIDIQIQSFGKQRGGVKTCYYEMPAEFKGQIDRVTKNTVCFKRIFVTGMYSDGTFFDGKEDHVWMDRSGFEEYVVGDCVTFFAEVYQYLKTSNGTLTETYAFLHCVSINPSSVHRKVKKKHEQVFMFLLTHGVSCGII